MSFGIQHHGTQTFRHTVGPISFCFFAQANQPLIGAGMQSQQAWQHTAPRYQYAIYVPLLMRGCISVELHNAMESGLRPDGETRIREILKGYVAREGSYLSKSWFEQQFGGIRNLAEYKYQLGQSAIL